jgi:hypothetical protein
MILIGFDELFRPDAVSLFDRVQQPVTHDVSQFVTLFEKRL